MRAQIRIEAIGDNVHQELRLWTNIANMCCPGIGDLTFGKSPFNYWVAKITGKDEKYKYAREFIRGKKDYTHANSKGSRGIFLYFLIESGFVYEVKGSKKRYFCKVSEDGEIIELTGDDVDEWIRDHSG